VPDFGFTRRGKNILAWLGLLDLVAFCYICSMSYLTDIKDSLLTIKPFLINQFHVSRIGLFGSIVRDDFSPASSDIDIIVEFNKPIGIEFVDLAEFIENKLQKKVDLVSKKGIKEKYLSQFESEIVYV
jgi:predicted nucleotidyltransferase